MGDMMTELQTAKRNVTWLLDHPRGWVDFHGLVYWAQRVETLRTEISAAL